MTLDNIASALCISLSAILPGLALSFAMFRKGELDYCQRLVLSFGLSIIVVALVVLWLNQFLHPGLTILNEILISVCLAFSVAVAAILVRVHKNWFTRLLRGVVTRSVKVRPMLATFEIPLVGLLVGLVYLSHLLHTGSAFKWAAFGALLLSFGTCRLACGRRLMGTPFDFAVFLYVSGAFVGLIDSPDRTISSGAFQCMLAMCLFYYSWLNHPHLATMMKFILPLSLLGLIAAFLIVFPQLGKPVSDSNPLPTTYHGLAMSLLVAAVILGAAAIFHTHRRTRIAAGLISLCLLIAMLVIVHDSLLPLVHGDSVGGRLARWEITVSLLRASPFTGLGLGCWALVYHDSMTIMPPTHVHNAYLELYANTGILGVIALLIALGVGVKLALQIMRSPRDREWYGFGIGTVAGCLAVLVVGLLESAPVGVAVPQFNAYWYLVSPAPWILCGLLVIAHRLITTGPRL